MDFGRDVLPRMIHECRVSAFLFDGYWEDIGTIKAFFEANLALCHPEPRFRFYTPDAPIFTRARFLPSSKLADCHLQDVIVADGCLIGSARISESVIGLRTRVGRESVIRRSVVMGSDFYEMPDQRQLNWERGLPNLGIGDECLIENAIIDKNARIGNRVQLRNALGIPRADGEFYAIRDGIIVIPKNAIVPEDTRL
jgi:glucose-1-phosphate adenylyltransferase